LRRSEQDQASTCGRTSSPRCHPEPFLPQDKLREGSRFPNPEMFRLAQHDKWGGHLHRAVPGFEGCLRAPVPCNQSIHGDCRRDKVCRHKVCRENLLTKQWAWFSLTRQARKEERSACSLSITRICIFITTLDITGALGVCTACRDHQSRGRTAKQPTACLFEVPANLQGRGKDSFSRPSCFPPAVRGIGPSGGTEQQSPAAAP
jgi:hypothetical protein